MGMVVQHLFGTLQGQFRRLKLKLDVDKVEDIPTIVIAICIMHKLSILHHEEIMDFWTTTPMRTMIMIIKIFSLQTETVFKKDET